MDEVLRLATERRDEEVEKLRQALINLNDAYQRLFDVGRCRNCKYYAESLCLNGKNKAIGRNYPPDFGCIFHERA